MEDLQSLFKDIQRSQRDGDHNKVIALCSEGLKHLLLVPVGTRAHKSIAALYTTRGMMYGLIRDYKHALADLNDALSISPGAASIFRERGMIFSAMGDIQHAIDDLTSSINLRPDYANSYLYRAKLKLQQGDPSAAEEDLNRCLELNPSCVDAYILRGDTRKSRSALIDAISDYERAYELSGDIKLILKSESIRAPRVRNSGSSETR